MGSRREGIPLGVLVAAVRSFADRHSIRSAAASIGMSPNGVRNLLAGASPHDRTVRKLTDWYLKIASREESDLSTDVAEAALLCLTRGLPLDRQRILKREFLRAVASEYKAAGIPIPSWVSNASDRK